MLRGRNKTKQNNDRCPHCGHFMVAPGKVWTARANAQRWERVGSPDAPLTQTCPVKPRLPRSVTLTRLGQAFAIGCCCSACVLPTSLNFSFGLPLTLGALLGVTCGTFILSVALGKENQEALFKLLDINRDGKLNMKDITTAVNVVLDEVLDDSDEPRPANEPQLDRVQLGYEVTRRMPDGTFRRAVLVPTQPRYLTAEKLRQVARVHEINNGKCNFSKRGCGEPFGDDLSAVQDQLEKLGYIQKTSKAANAPRVWTPEGERWLEQF